MATATHCKDEYPHSRHVWFQAQLAQLGRTEKVSRRQPQQLDHGILRTMRTYTYNLAAAVSMSIRKDMYMSMTVWTSWLQQDGSRFIITVLFPSLNINIILQYSGT